MSNSRERASSAPLYASLMAAVGSVILLALPSLRLVSNSDASTSILGWVLTPVLTFTLYGVDFYLQNRTSNSSNFIYRPGIGKALKILGYGSIVLCLFHIWRLASLMSVV